STVPLQSVSTDIVPRATTSPSKTPLSPLTPQPAGRNSAQLPSPGLPGGTDAAMRISPLADGVADETKTSREGLKAGVPAAVCDPAAPRTAARTNAFRQLPGIVIAPFREFGGEGGCPLLPFLQRWFPQPVISRKTRWPRPSGMH